MPEMFRTRFEKMQPSREGSQPGAATSPGVRGFFRSGQKHLRHLRHLRNPAISEVASLLARGFLRLTEKRRNDALSWAGGPQIPLDVLRQQLPHEVGDQPRRRSRWRTA